MSLGGYLTHCRVLLQRDPMRLSRRRGKKKLKKKKKLEREQVLSPWRHQSSRDASAMSTALVLLRAVNPPWRSISIRLQRVMARMYRWGEYTEEDRKFGSNASRCCIVSDLCPASQQRRPRSDYDDECRRYVCNSIRLFSLSFGWGFLLRVCVCRILWRVKGPKKVFDPFSDFDTIAGSGEEVELLLSGHWYHDVSHSSESFFEALRSSGSNWRVVSGSSSFSSFLQSSNQSKANEAEEKPLYEILNGRNDARAVGVWDVHLHVGLSYISAVFFSHRLIGSYAPWPPVET